MRTGSRASPGSCCAGASRLASAGAAYAAGEDRLQSEVGERILQVREEPLHRAHRRVRHVLQREAHALLVLPQRCDGMPQLVAVEGHQRPGMRGQPELDERPAARIVLEELAHEPARRALDEAEDRKSTRLNSSHRCISYAVFCLKKKKEK